MKGRRAGWDEDEVDALRNSRRGGIIGSSLSQKIGLERVVRYGSTHREGRGELVGGHFAVQCAARGKAGGWWEGAPQKRRWGSLERVSLLVRAGESPSPNVAPVTPISRPNGFASHSNRLADSCPAAESLDTTKANSWIRFAALRIFWGSKLESGGGAPSGLPLARYPARKYRYLPVSDPNPSWTRFAGLFRVRYESPDGARRTRLVSQRPAPAGAGLGSVLAEGLIMRDRHSPADSSLPRVAGLRWPEMAC